MKRWITTAAAFLAAVLLLVGPAMAQAQKPATPQATPQKVEGQVVKVDANAGKVTVKGSDGTVHEFQASKETIQNLKPGDHIELTLRSAK